MKYPQLVSMPSAVSDWLEEQLEARGIDAVVYTRYILSLLHSDNLDVIYSEEDSPFSHLKKEVRRSGGNRKRFRRSSDWWKYAQADAEKLKRSAAVECLMSAADQTCGIESLIDELCAKLNEVKSDTSATEEEVDPPSKEVTFPEQKQQHVSLQEQAKRYYAAFPALSHNNNNNNNKAITSTTSPTQFTSLLPKWLPSPKKKPPLTSYKNSHLHPISRKQNNHHYGHTNNHSYDDKMKASRSTATKPRFGVYFPGRNMNNNKKEVATLPYKSTVGQKSFDNNVIRRPRLEASAKVSSSFKHSDDELNEDWNMSEDLNLYDDLPVDIKELLDDESPISHDVTVAMMNLANMRDTGNRRFLPCGTNITSSIWTDESAMEYDTIFNNEMLDVQFSSFSLDQSSGNSEVWNNDTSFFWGVPREKWSDDSVCVDDDSTVVNQLTNSLSKLKHDKQFSAFAEVLPKKQTIHHHNHNYYNNPFSKVVGSGVFHRDTLLKMIDGEKEKDDLLTSIKSHFRPINEKVDSHVQGQYADGATFIISNNWDKINYKRTESGAMYMESDYGIRKKYCEYKMKTGPSSMEFVLKYLVRQNDKGCQTDEVDAEVAKINTDHTERLENVKKNALNEGTTGTLATKTDYSTDYCLVDDTKNIYEKMENEHTLAMNTAEISWQHSCDKCNNNSLWNDSLKCKDNLNEMAWEFGAMSKIWSGGVVCHACLGRPPSTLQHSKLREDVSQDGDQLLSDLSSVQKSYMQETTAHNVNLPLSEFSCDISELLLPKEQRKRRHSLLAPTANNQLDEWSFASRLEEDCLIQMSAIPTLRSVTL